MNEDGTINKDLECHNLINLIYEPVNEKSKQIYSHIENVHNTLVDEVEETEIEDIKDFEEEYQEKVQLLRLEKERKDYAYKKAYEIQNLNDNNGKFIKSLSVPLHKI